MKLCQMKHRFPDFFIFCFSDPCSCNKYHIQTTIGFLKVQPEGFPDQSRSSVSYNTVSDLFAYGYTDPVSAKVIAANIHDQHPIGIGSAVFINSAEL